MVFALLTASLALATPGTPSDPVVGADSSITTDVLIPASIAEVRAILADPDVASRLSGSILSVDVLGRDGGCDLVAITCKGMMSPMAYTIRRCSTADGFTETLVSSEDFTAQSTKWRLETVAGGTLVTFSVNTAPKVSVPRRIIQAVVESSAVETLENLVRKVTGR